MNRLFHVQYLRALAALAVVLLHAGKRVEADLPEVLTRALSIGHAGVDLFFIISGFIMWSIGARGGLTPGGFLLRRILRVAPLYWIATLMWLAMVIGLGSNWIHLTPTHVLASLGFVPHFSPTFPDSIWPVLVPGWTLNYEMFFYTLFAVTLFVPGRARLAVLVAVLLALVGLGLALKPVSAVAITYTNPLLLEFLAGCLIAAFVPRGPRAAGLSLFLLALGLASLVLLGLRVTPETGWSRLYGFGGPMALILIATLGLATWMPRLPRFERLGDASYSVYLFHTIALLPMSAVWNRIPALHGPVAALVFVAVATVCAVLIGLALHRWLELPLHDRLLRLFLSNERRQDVPSR